MPKARKFLVTLQSQTDEHKRFLTVSTVPCPACEGDPYKRGGYYVSAESKKKTPVCSSCNGSGEVQATRDSAVAFAEAKEAEYTEFRLDEGATLARYRDSMPENALEIVEHTVQFHPEDTHTVDGRFLRAGKVTATGSPEAQYQKSHKGWMQFHHQEKPYKVVSVGATDIVAAVTGGMYGVPVKGIYAGTANAAVDWDTDTIKLALTTSSYTVDIDTHDFFNDVTNELTTAGNYTAGGWTLTASAPSYDTATDQIRLDATDVSQASATFTARRAVVYKSTGTASTSPLISFLDFGADVSPSAGTFTITFDATGVVVIDVT